MSYLDFLNADQAPEDAKKAARELAEWKASVEASRRRIEADYQPDDLLQPILSPEYIRSLEAISPQEQNRFLRGEFDGLEPKRGPGRPKKQP